MSSLKTVQEEIEKALAANLKARFNSGINKGDIDESEFDETDLEKLKRNNFETEIYLRLFIRSRQGDLEKSFDTMKNSLKWRKTYGIREVNESWLAEEDVDKVVQKGLLFYHNTDLKKNPILIFEGNKYSGEVNKEKRLEKLFAYLLERQHQKYFGKQILVICDHQNATLDQLDFQFFKFVVDLFNIYYPNILYSFLVVGVSWRVSAAWRSIQKWFSPDTAAKFKFVDKPELTNYVEKSKLLHSLGGLDRYVFEYPAQDGTQNPFEPLADEGRTGASDTESGFEDAIEHLDEIRVSEELIPRESGSLTTENMGSSLGTPGLRKRRGNKARELQSSMEDIPPSEIDEGSDVELQISPNKEITFQEIPDAKEIHETITLANNCPNRIIFKIKTNSAANFRVKPSMGALEPSSTKKVIVMLLLKGEASQEKHQWDKDKFLILFAEHIEEITSETNIAELWRDTPKSYIREHKLNCRVLDVNGLEKRPKTIDDAIELNLKLQQQMSQLQEKMENFTNPLNDIQEKLKQQKLFLIVMSIFILILFLLFCWFR